jgi:N6-L-threonylcarbamoyladenine synthase
MIHVLAVETSCDETSAAVVGADPSGVRVLSSIVASQIELHAQYGGVVPELASRRHVEAIVPSVLAALREAGLQPSSLDGVCATVGPGLVGALLVGLNFAKGFAAARGLPFVGVNHLDGHLHAIFLEDPPPYPFVALLVSGGHTHLYRVNGFADYHLLGRTLDDAAGEAFDKAAKILGLPYPGGPSIDRVARQGNRSAFSLPRGLMGRGLDFSFSGLKTSVLLKARELGHGLEAARADLAASTQEAITEVLAAKLLQAMKGEGLDRGVVSGGVAANTRLREILAEHTAGTTRTIRFPSTALCTDNAAMIGYVGAQRLLRGERDPWSANANPALALTLARPGETA